VTAFPNARASAIQSLSLQQMEPGVYLAPLRVVLAGEWEFRLTATSNDTIFTNTARVVVPPNP
jgi:hypothetical protein